MSARKPSTPWYRQAWPWFLIALPATAVVAGIATIWLAVRSDDGLVAGDYYKKGLAIEQTLVRAREAAQLGLEAVVVFAPQAVEVTLVSATGAPLPYTLFLTLSHPTRSALDRTLSLVGHEGRYKAEMPAADEGRWRILLENESRAWRLSGTIHLPTETEVRLLPPSPTPVDR